MPYISLLKCSLALLNVLCSWYDKWYLTETKAFWISWHNTVSYLNPLTPLWWGKRVPLHLCHLDGLGSSNFSAQPQCELEARGRAPHSHWGGVRVESPIRLSLTLLQQKGGTALHCCFPCGLHSHHREGLVGFVNHWVMMNILTLQAATADPTWWGR